jgi:hypothetical protein
MNTVKGNSASKMRTSVVFASILACLIVVGAGSATAADKTVLRNQNYFYVNGQCCISLNETVTITEPATLQPVIVHWSAGYSIEVTDNYQAGLSVNGGACSANAGAGAGYGPEVIPDFELGYPGNFSHVDFQWIILPSDGVLKTGTNTFELCGGGANSTSDSIVINTNTLSVQLAAR